MDCGYLEYEDKFCWTTSSESFLLIASTGLCVERLFLRHLEIYSDPSVLALVIGTSQYDQDYLCECVRKRRCAEPKRLTGAAGTGDRSLLYLEGGVQFVTTNVLVNDLLNGRLPTHLVTVILLYRAHSIVRSALEAFVLRTVRQKNRQCLVKAFSDDPRAFCESFGQLQRVASLLQVHKIHFIPRFRAEVIKCLQNSPPSLVEVAVNMSPCMKLAQSLLLELLNACLHELRQCKLPSADAFTQEAVLLSSMARLLSAYLGPNYEDCINERAKVLIQDVNDIKKMLRSLEHDDGKTFSSLLNVLKRNETIFHNSSGWLFTATAQKLFDAGEKIAGEMPNKWEALNSVLKELFDAFSADNRSSAVVAVFVCDDSVAKQLVPVAERWIKVVDDDQRKDRFLPYGTLVETDMTNLIGVSSRMSPTIFLIPLKERYSVLRGLFYLSPAAVVMYDVDLWLVRQLEMYYATAVHRDAAFRIFFLMYDKSTEEERYLKAMRREKTAFEQLFREETALVVQESVEVPVADDETSSATEQTVVVDMREFRSELPTVLHTKGIKLAPVVLSVGDYVLSPQICVERKAVSDLIGSLLHGRLYLQCQAMSSFYERPTLLIEMSDCEKTWRHLGDIYAAKLAALTLNFPTLRLLWAVSPLAAAELMIDFKWKREEPDVNQAVSYGKKEAEDTLKYLQGQSSSIIRCLPGVSAKDIAPILKSKYSLRGLACMSEEQLRNTMLFGTHCKELYDFINTDFSDQSKDHHANKRLKKS